MIRIISVIIGLLICPISHGKKQIIERYASDANKTVFIPKSTWMGGFSISYRENFGDNMNITVLKNLNGEGYSFGIGTYGGYFFKDNQAAGLRFSFDRTKVDLKNLDLNLGEDFNINLDHIYYIANSYDVSGFWRVYMPIAKSKIFAIFNETRLCYSYSQGKNSTGSGVEYNGSYTTSNDIKVGVAPGVTAFITNNAAVEVSVGLMGVNFGWSDQITNQIENGNSHSASASFKIDLFSLNLGMVVYL